MSTCPPNMMVHRHARVAKGPAPVGKRAGSSTLRSPVLTVARPSSRYMWITSSPDVPSTFARLGPSTAATTAEACGYKPRSPSRARWTPPKARRLTLGRRARQARLRPAPSGVCPPCAPGMWSPRTSRGRRTRYTRGKPLLCELAVLRNEKVRGSNPLSSTIRNLALASQFSCFVIRIVAARHI